MRPSVFRYLVIVSFIRMLLVCSRSPAGPVAGTRSVPECLLSMAAKHTWEFRSRLRTRAFGWRGSHLGCQRLKEAVAEIKGVARADPVTAGDGVVTLMERIWPAFQNIDTSSGALGGVVYWAQQELQIGRASCRERV